MPFIMLLRLTPSPVTILPCYFSLVICIYFQLLRLTFFSFHLLKDHAFYGNVFVEILKKWIRDLKLMQILIQAHFICRTYIYIHMKGLNREAPGISTTN